MKLPPTSLALSDLQSESLSHWICNPILIKSELPIAELQILVLNSSGLQIQNSLSYRYRQFSHFVEILANNTNQLKTLLYGKDPCGMTARRVIWDELIAGFLTLC